MTARTWPVKGRRKNSTKRTRKQNVKRTRMRLPTGCRSPWFQRAISAERPAKSSAHTITGMALFTDGPISTLDQLAAQDTAVLDVASTEGIDATAKLTLAQQEVGIELTAVLTRSIRSGVYSFWWPGNPLTFLGPLQLQYIVVTSPLQLSHTFQTLAILYRDAYNHELNAHYSWTWN